MYNEERNVMEMRKMDECDMDKFSALDNSEKTIAILGDSLLPSKRQTGREYGRQKCFMQYIEKTQRAPKCWRCFY